MTTLNYDEAVPYYDETRGFRPGVSQRYRDAVRRVAANDSPRALELAIGTGLIGLPFIAAGDDYIGVDVSHGMMQRIAPKLPSSASPSLAQVDITDTLPFAADSFDITHAVRVFHLLHDWRRCISESRRVLKPDGALIIVEMRTPDETASPPPWALVHHKWAEILRGMGIGDDSIRHGNGLTEATLANHIRAIGGRAKIQDLLRYDEFPVSCRTMVERRAKRMFSNDWSLPDRVFTAATRQLQRWLEQDCAFADQAVARRMVFRAVIARF